jgi:lipopolysaccharide biosynthesis protein
MNTSTTIDEIKPVKKHATAVVLHLYYTELFSEVQSYLDHLDDAFDLFLSINEDQSAYTENIRAKYPDASILIIPNRGRDLAPFLEFLKIIVPLEYETLLKVHTKKTLHREDGTTW